ncbi:hypothetical protein KAU11_09975 [Candidatus Babeliales bacterium]|nr:hypothetical protein [Candidatus Babeliales bacterium]
MGKVGNWCVVDDVDTDLVGEGDHGRPRMTIDRKQIMAGYDGGSGSSKTSESKPIFNQHLEETLADITNEASGVTTERYVDLDGYRNNTSQVEIDSATDVVTVTFEGTLQDDGTAPADITDWQDITQYGMTIQTASATAANYTADVITSIAQSTSYKWLKIKTVTSGGTGDADYRIFNKKVY